MKRVLLLIILTLTLYSCAQISSNDKESSDGSNNLINRKDALKIDTSSLTILKTNYVLSLQGQKWVAENKEQLSEILKNYDNTKDSLYIFIEDSDRIEDAMEVIHNSKIDKYRIIIKNEFFKLPYPDKK